MKGAEMQKILIDLGALCKGKGGKKTIGCGTFTAFLENHLPETLSKKAIREMEQLLDCLKTGAPLPNNSSDLILLKSGILVGNNNNVRIDGKVALEYLSKKLDVKDLSKVSEQDKLQLTEDIRSLEEALAHVESESVEIMAIVNPTANNKNEGKKTLLQTSSSASLGALFDQARNSAAAVDAGADKDTALDKEVKLFAIRERLEGLTKLHDKLLRQSSSSLSRSSSVDLSRTSSVDLHSNNGKENSNSGGNGYNGSPESSGGNLIENRRKNEKKAGMLQYLQSEMGSLENAVGQALDDKLRCLSYSSMDGQALVQEGLFAVNEDGSGSGGQQQQQLPKKKLIDEEEREKNEMGLYKDGDISYRFGIAGSVRDLLQAKKLVKETKKKMGMGLRYIPLGQDIIGLGLDGHDTLTQLTLLNHEQKPEKLGKAQELIDLLFGKESQNDVLLELLALTPRPEIDQLGGICAVAGIPSSSIVGHSRALGALGLQRSVDYGPETRPHESEVPESKSKVSGVSASISIPVSVSVEGGIADTPQTNENGKIEVEAEATATEIAADTDTDDVADDSGDKAEKPLGKGERGQLVYSTSRLMCVQPNNWLMSHALLSKLKEAVINTVPRTSSALLEKGLKELFTGGTTLGRGLYVSDGSEENVVKVDPNKAEADLQAYVDSQERKRKCTARLRELILHISTRIPAALTMSRIHGTIDIDPPPLCYYTNTNTDTEEDIDKDNSKDSTSNVLGTFEGSVVCASLACVVDKVCQDNENNEETNTHIQTHIHSSAFAHLREARLYVQTIDQFFQKQLFNQAVLSASQEDQEDQDMWEQEQEQEQSKSNFNSHRQGQGDNSHSKGKGKGPSYGAHRYATGPKGSSSPTRGSPYSTPMSTARSGSNHPKSPISNASNSASVTHSHVNSPRGASDSPPSLSPSRPESLSPRSPREGKSAQSTHAVSEEGEGGEDEDGLVIAIDSNQSNHASSRDRDTSTSRNTSPTHSARANYTSPIQNKAKAHNPVTSVHGVQPVVMDLNLEHAAYDSWLKERALILFLACFIDNDSDVNKTKSNTASKGGNNDKDTGEAHALLALSACHAASKHGVLLLLLAAWSVFGGTQPQPMQPQLGIGLIEEKEGKGGKGVSQDKPCTPKELCVWYCTVFDESSAFPPLLSSTFNQAQAHAHDGNNDGLNLGVTRQIANADAVLRRLNRAQVRAEKGLLDREKARNEKITSLLRESMTLGQ